MNTTREIPNNDANVLSFTVSAMLTAVAFALGIYGAWAYDVGYGSLSFGAWVGGCVLIWRIRQHDFRAWRIVEVWSESEESQRPQQQVIINSPGREWCYIENQHTRQYVYQPDAGAFAKMLREASSVNTRTQLSQRLATSAGYTPKEYEVIVAQLRALCWLTSEVKNNAPVFNPHALHEIQEWLQQPPPYQD